MQTEQKMHCAHYLLGGVLGSFEKVAKWLKQGYWVGKIEICLRFQTHKTIIY